MKCTICKHGNTTSGKMTTIFERDGAIIVIKNVPAQICETCGESYLSQEISSELLKQVESAANQGVQVDIRNFLAA